MLSQTRTQPGHMFPRPMPGEIVYETPPAFCWLKVPGVTSYRIIVTDSNNREIWSAETEKNAAVPDFILPAGQYRWNLWGDGEERGWQDFAIAANASAFLRPTAGEVLAGLPDERPRHLFAASDIETLRKTRTAELETLRRNVALALSRPIPAPPLYHTKEASVTILDMRYYIGGTGGFREDCDRDLVACALASILLKGEGKDSEIAEAAGVRARKVFLTILGWNPDGPCSPNGEWGDEPGLSLSRCLPAVFDLLYNKLDDRERRLAARTLARYATMCEERLNKLDFLQNPGDSHCGRIPAYLGEAALALSGTGAVSEETLKRWLSYSLEIYGSVFPHFGGPDGGWAEGVFYGSSYTKWYLPFFSAVARFSGKNFLDRPFYQRLPHFFLHFAAPGRENHPFCDGYWCNSDDDEWPGFYAQNPFRVYAARTGPSLAKDWAKRLAAPEIFKLHLLDVFLPDMPPPESCVSEDVSEAQSFPDTGFAALHTDIANPEHDTVLLTRASKYGRVSHQHADQGNFALIHGGTTLITPSGYFGSGYGTRHHFEWTRSTHAHNCILIDGQPQPMEFTSTGRISRCGIDGTVRSASLDLSAAYPALSSYTRSFTLEARGPVVVVTVRDTLTADKPVTVSYLNHTLSEPSCNADGTVTVERAGTTLVIKPVRGLLPNVTCTDKFAVDVNEGVPQEYWADMPPQYHLCWTGEEAEKHEIVVEYTVYPEGLAALI